MVCDRDGKVTALWGAPELSERFGIRSEKVVGRSIREFVTPEYVEKILAGIASVFDFGEKMIVEYDTIVPGGKFCHEVSFSPMRDAIGNIVAVVGFAKDIAARKQVEERLKSSTF
jgi:PAS domain S-box-containing protein